MPGLDNKKLRLTLGFGWIAVVFKLQVISPFTTGLTSLYPVAILGALWTKERWVVFALGIVGTLAVLKTSPLETQRIVGTLIAIWLTAFIFLLRNKEMNDGQNALLRSTLECLPAGLVVYDKEDRMVLCNAANKALYPAVANLMVLGVTFEDMVRATADRDLYVAGETVEEYIQERIQLHKSCGPPHTQTLSDGRRLFIKETEMPDGGILVLRTDITALS